jgi:hypothetical protein
MASLRRIRDGEGDSGARVEAISWNEDGTFKEIVGHKPIIGCSLLVGSITARSYSDRDFWLTTPVTEILEEWEKEDGVYVKFRTENSDYEFFSGNTSLWAETFKKIKDEIRTTEEASE